MTADEKERELEKARRDTMEIQLKVYDLQRDLDDEREKRKKDKEKHESVVQGRRAPDEKHNSRGRRKGARR